jgi:hypothetical protein
MFAEAKLKTSNVADRRRAKFPGFSDLVNITAEVIT